MGEDRTMTRRNLLQRATALAGIYAGRGLALAEPILSEFGYGEVQLAPGPQQR
jgi:hypothetical protein